MRGKLVDTDNTHLSYCQSIDCRSPEELDILSPKYLPKSRAEGISFFISNYKSNLPQYNDIKFPVNENILQYAEEYGHQIGVELDANLKVYLNFLL